MSDAFKHQLQPYCQQVMAQRFQKFKRGNYELERQLHITSLYQRPKSLVECMPKFLYCFLLSS